MLLFRLTNTLAIQLTMQLCISISNYLKGHNGLNNRSKKSLNSIEISYKYDDMNDTDKQIFVYTDRWSKDACVYT